MPESIIERDIRIAVRSPGAEDAAGKVSALVSSFFSLRGAAIAAGAALGFFSAKALGKAASAAAGFEQQMAEVNKVLGPDTNFAEVNEDIRQMAVTELPMAQNELATIAADAARFGIRGADKIRTFTRTIAEMAVATELGADEAGAAMARLLNMFDLSADKTRNVAATVNMLSNTMATDSERIVEAAGKSASSLSALGATAPETLTLAAAVSTLRMSSARAGTRLRRVAQVLMNPETVNRLAKAFGVSAERLKAMRNEAPVKTILALANAFRNNEAAAERLRRIFPTSVVASFTSLSRVTDELEGRLGKSAEQFQNMGSLAKELNIFIETLNGHIQNMQDVLRDIMIETGEFLLPVLKSFIDVLTRVLKKIAKWNRATDGALVGLTLLVAAVGGLAIALGAILALFGALSSGGALAAFSGSLSSIAPVVLLLLLKLGLLVLLFKDDWPEIKKVVKDVADTVKKKLEDLDPVLESVADSAKKLAGAVKELASVKLEEFGIAGPLKEIEAIDIAALVALFPLLAMNITAVVGAIVGLAKVWETNFANIRSELTNAFNDIKRTVMNTFSVVAQQGQKVIDELLDVAEILGVKGTLVTAAKGGFGILQFLFEGFVFVVETILDDLVTVIVTPIKLAFQLLAIIIGTGLDFWMTLFLAFLHALQGEWKQAWNEIKDFVDRIISGIIQFFKDLKRDIIGNSIIPEMFEAIATYVKGTGKQIVHNAFNLLLKGIKSLFKFYKKQIFSILASIIQKAQKAIQKARQALNIGQNGNGNDGTSFVDPVRNAREKFLRRHPNITDNVATPDFVPGGHEDPRMFREARIEVHANGEEEGQMAGEAFVDELRSRNV